MHALVLLHCHTQECAKDIILCIDIHWAPQNMLTIMNARMLFLYQYYITKDISYGSGTRGAPTSSHAPWNSNTHIIYLLQLKYLCQSTQMSFVGPFACQNSWL